MTQARYNWKNAPNGTIAGTRDEDGEGYWLAPETVSNSWVSGWTKMDPSDILDDSGDWRDSLELHPSHTLPIWTACQTQSSSTQDEIIEAEKISKSYSKIMAADLIVSFDRKPDVASEDIYKFIVEERR